MQENFAAASEAVPAETVAVEGSVKPKKARKPINQQKLQDNLWGWVFCIPLIVGTIWFVYIAFVMALLLSFTAYNSIKGDIWETLFHLGDNIHPDGAFYWYKYAFTYEIGGDFKMNEMGAYLFNTVFYMIGIPIGMILAVFFAVCMSRDIKGGNVFRVLYYFPCVASTVSIVYTFKLMFSTTGVMNQLLGLDGFQWLDLTGSTTLTWNQLAGTSTPGAFMNDPFWCQGFFSKLVIIIMSVWKGLGGTIILYIAGLSGVNAATKEAAEIDGANGWQIFWKVTMPDLYPTIFYNIVTAVIGGMQIYMEPVLLVGERSSTSGYVSLIWGYGVNQSKVSQGAAYGMILAIMIFVLTMFQFWLDSRKSD